MKKVLFALILAVPFLSLVPPSGVIGKKFPEMLCEDYNEKNVLIPTKTLGKYTLLGLAFSKDAESDLKTWINPIYNKFIAEEDAENSNVFAVSYDYDVNLYFIPMFTGASKVTSAASKKKIRELTNEELYPHLLFYEGKESYKEELEFGKKNVPYFFVLDKAGKIVYATSGNYDNKKMEEILDIIEEN